MLIRGRTCLTFALVALFGLAVFLPTLQWGLPSRESDRILFGDREPWSGKEILSLLEDHKDANPLPRDRGRGQGEREDAREGEVTRNETIDRPLTSTRSADYRGEGTRTDWSSSPRGADVDANPILDRSKPIILNDTDAKRAEIVQRYRLMSKQPDEFIQFKALAEMSQRQGLSKLDPRLYQYGGLWVYPVGALVRGAMLIGYIEQPPAAVPAREFYLDHPDAFGRFYIVARAYSTMWGIVAALAIVWITKRLTHSNGLAALAAIAFVLLPVTRTAAHEAKPHLAGAALCLCAVVAATCYFETGRKRCALLAGALCGASMAMVVSMLLSLAVLPMMAWLRWRQSPTAQIQNPRFPDRRDKGTRPALLSSLIPTLLSLLAAFLVYVLFNPFLLYNALFHPEILRSNLGNSTAMYGIGNLGAAFVSALRIAIEGMTLGGVILAAVSIVMVLVARFTRWDSACVDRGEPTVLPINARAAASETSHLAGEASLASSNARDHATVACLLAAPAICVLIQFILLAAGKPAEYARFGLVVAAATMVGMAWTAAHLLATRAERVATGLVIIQLIVTIFSIVLFDPNVRGQAFLLRNELNVYGKNFWTLGLAYEPAPWSVMPLNLFRDQLILTRPAGDPKAAIYDVYLYPSNLSSQLGLDRRSESVDWARNRTEMIMGSLPPVRTTTRGAPR